VGTALATLVAVVFTVGISSAGPAYGDGSLSGRSILQQQQSVVSMDHRGPIALAQLAVSEFTATVDRDRASVAVEDVARAEAAAAMDEAITRLSDARSALDAATDAYGRAESLLTSDRARLRAIAVGLYTGALTDPQPASLNALEADQEQVIDTAEVELVAGVVDAHLRTDLAVAALDGRQRTSDAATVVADGSVEVAAQAAAARTAAAAARDTAGLTADQGRLDGAEHQLAGADAALTAALTAVAGPASAPPGQLSLLGGAALDATQLVAWYDYQGYVDLTSAPIPQLAAWYLQAGAAEGIRGDVAFAQAVLETGGFSSPDAVNLSNFAGIGHCDSCSAGWGFPSPQGGVIGHVQLLRIFADSSPPPAGAPAPVLPALTVAKQSEAGCCSTVESLTGVWASDPTYGAQILDLYGQMLDLALAAPSN
jgi:hypothetical protein